MEATIPTPDESTSSRTVILNDVMDLTQACTAA
jgi:hypothetical protein